MDLSNTTALLTGAAGSIGRATVQELLDRGASVIASDVTSAGLSELEEHKQLATVQADVTDRQSVADMVAFARERLGHVDVLINNAALLSGIGPMWKVDPDKWWADLTVNLLGTFHCVQAVLPEMMERNRGTILNMVGGGLGTPNPAGSGYGCSKAALARLTDTLAEELTEYPGVRVFALAPGFIRSTITRDLATHPDAMPWFQFVKDWLEEGRDNSPESVAAALCDMAVYADELPNGRIFRYSDSMAEMAQQREDIESRDTQQIRYLED
jgi:NAD(P)-dependent dehydrogenase (short-subunit alcohol dehydrogenase family)